MNPRVMLTDAGAARYEQLCRLQHRALQVPDPQFGAAQRRAGVDDPGPFGGTVLP